MKSSVNFAIIALLWLALVLACAEPKTSSPQTNVNNLQPTTSPQITANSNASQKETTQQIKTKELATYTKYSSPHKVVLVPANLMQEQLIDLARQLHEANPDTSFDLFDAETEVQKFIDWDKNRNSEDSGKKYFFPEKFVHEHRVASIMKLRRNKNEEMKWHLVDDGGTTIAVLD